MGSKPLATRPLWRTLLGRFLEILTGVSRTSSSGCAGDPDMYDPRLKSPKTKD